MGKKWALFAVSLLLLVGCSSISSNGATSTVALPYAGELRGAVFDPPRTLADFSVASTTGDDFTLSDHQGQLILLYFGYRSCPDFCPTTFAQLRRIYTELNEPADKLKIVFVTIDPERDTLEYMRQYTAGFHPDFIGLRAEGQALEQLEDQFGVVAERRIVGD